MTDSSRKFVYLYLLLAMKYFKIYTFIIKSINLICVCWLNKPFWFALNNIITNKTKYKMYILPCVFKWMKFYKHYRLKMTCLFQHLFINIQNKCFVFVVIILICLFLNYNLWCTHLGKRWHGNIRLHSFVKCSLHPNTWNKISPSGH